MKKLLILTLISTFLLNTVAIADITSIDKMGGLARNPKADRIADGENDKFNNMFIDYGNLQVIKGRQKLNTTANSDTVVNGLFYYESQDTSTKKLIVAESTNLVSYNTNGTSRTVIASGLTNEKWDSVQIGDTLYLTSSTNGLYKWTGSGSATAITGVTTPSTFSPSSSSNVGGLTCGLPAIVAPVISQDTSSYTRGTTGAGTCVKTFPFLRPNQTGTSSCGSLSGTDWTTVCATSSTYKYKTTFYNSLTGIESQPSSASSVSLTGDDTVIWQFNDCFVTYGSDSTCATANALRCIGQGTTRTTGCLSSTSGTVPTTPPSPFDKYKIYRTVAGGSDYFLVGIGDPSSTYTDGKPDSALSTPLDTTIQTTNPPSYRYIEEYKGVIFLAEGNKIQFNKIPVGLTTDADKYWLATDELQVVGNIRGMIKASDSLIIFTDKIVYQLTGFGVESFRLVPIVTGVGAISDETIKRDNNGDVYFFAGTEGMYKLSVGEQPTDNLNGAIVSQRNSKLTKVSDPNMDGIFNGIDTLISLSPSTYQASHAYYDTDRDYYHLYIDQHEFMFDPVHNAWSYIPATKMIASVWRKSKNEAGQAIMLDNMGFFYNNWYSYSQGVVSGTVTGNGTSFSSNTLTCSGCTFNTTNDGLKGVWIYIDNELGEYQQILSNTATTITINGSWNVTPITSDKFYIGYIVANWRTKQYSVAKPPAETSVTHLYINHNKADSTQELFVLSYQDKSSIAENSFSENGSIDLSSKFIHTINTRMRSSWVQWEFKSFVYNTSDTANPPIDIVSYAIDAEQKDRIN